MAEPPAPAEVEDTAEEENGLPEGVTLESVDIGSIPSEFDISSMEVRRIQAAQSFNLGSEMEVARDIFNRPEDSDDAVGEGEDAERYVLFSQTSEEGGGGYGVETESELVCTFLS